MAAFNVPGFKASKGQSGFTRLDAGSYDFKCLACTVKEDEKSPTDIWTFKFEVLKGPPQADGSAAKGKIHYEFVRIKQEKHPDYDPLWDDPASGKSQMGVDQMKSMALAMGVNGKGNSLNPDAFAGQTCGADLVHTPNKKKEGEFFVNSRNWLPAE